MLCVGDGKTSADKIFGVNNHSCVLALFYMHEKLTIKLLSLRLKNSIRCIWLNDEETTEMWKKQLDSFKKQNMQTMKIYRW